MIIPSNTLSCLEKAISIALDTLVKEEVDILIKEYTKKLNSRVLEISAGVAAQVQRQVQIRYLNDEIIISIRLPQEVK